MKILKRILTVSFAVLVIFCIVCTSVFAVNPSFPDFDLSSKYMYSPASNLQSVLYPMDYNGVTRYTSLTSPYSLFNVSPLAGWAQDESVSLSHYIGSYYTPSGSSQPATVGTYFDFKQSPGGVGPYTRSFVDFSQLVSNTNSSSPLIFEYGQSVIPILGRHQDLTNGETRYPFLPHYYVNFYYVDMVYYRFYLRAEVSVDVLCFEYSFDDDKFTFTESPHFETFTFSILEDVPLNESLCDESGLYTFDLLLDFDDELVDLATQNMVNTTSSATSPKYICIDRMSVSLSLTSPDPDMDPGMMILNQFGPVDYYFQNTDSDLLIYYPELDQFTDWFSETYPVYTLPDGFDDLNFTDFLLSIGSIFDVELFGTFSLSDLLLSIIGIGFVIWFIKMFAGG